MLRAEQIWPVEGPTLIAEKWLPAADVDGLHYIWPDWWPPASAVYGGDPCRCAWCAEHAAGVSGG